jgi:NAD(P)-dependent dehydrogenase (short-subunit alcohol dehydrogenase family)
MALDLARRGWDLWIHCRGSRDEALSLAARIEALGRDARVVQADLAEPGGAEALAQALSPAPPSLVVHSASLWSEDTAATASADAWERSHRLHAWTAVVLARALSLVSSRERPGHLVALLDARLRDRDARHFSYAFAKRELALLTRYLAAEFAPAVRVNGIAPGMVLRDEATSAAEWARVGRSSVPLGRAGKSADVVKALRYLVDNPYVTGQILAVDGGRHLKGDLFGSL